MAKQGNSVLAAWLYASGVFVLVIGVIAAFVIGPAWVFAIFAAVATADFAMATAFGRGWIGGGYGQAGLDDTAPEATEVDPSYNPYARED